MQIPGYSQLIRAYRNLSPLETVIFLVLSIILITSTIMLAGDLQNELSESTPTRGGTYTEGIVGFPQYINPVLARTDADKDAAALVYAGLTKLTTDGSTELDLAADMRISPDGETYTFTLRDDARFHDGHPVGAEDVVYTVSMIQDQRINSPLQADWSGVLVRAVDEKTVAFDLPQAFQSFPYNTRLGILPKHLWEEETTSSFPFSSLNTVPIGAGPYEIGDVERNNEGIPVGYQLTAVDSAHNSPLIQQINLLFFSSSAALQEALQDGEVDGMYGSDPTAVEMLSGEASQVLENTLNRVFAVYFNQNNNEQLVDADVRQALSMAVSREEIIDAVLGGYGTAISGPTPDARNNNGGSDLEAAGELLTDSGWELQDGRRTNDNGELLSLSLTTAAIPQLEATADIIVERWESLGVTVELTSLQTSDLLRDVIRPREYEALLFGQLLSQSGDLHPFWHSSGQDDPGLNLAMYANTNVDEALSSWRTATSSAEQDEIRQVAVESITADRPAVFLYAPNFIYILPEKIKDVAVPPITTPADRFAQIEDWYIRTNELWSVFSADNLDETTTGATSTPAATTTDTSTSTQDQ